MHFHYTVINPTEKPKLSLLMNLAPTGYMLINNLQVKEAKPLAVSQIDPLFHT